MYRDIKLLVIYYVTYSNLRACKVMYSGKPHAPDIVCIDRPLIV